MNKAGTLHFLIGKMGAGKSTYATRFAADTGAVLIGEDEWLSQLYPGEITTFNDFVIRHRQLLTILGPHVQQILASGCSVILDSPANTVEDRQWFLAVAEAVNAPHRAVYLNVSNDTCLKQITQRRIEQPARRAFDTPEMFETVTQYFEKPSVSEGLNIDVID